MTYGGVQSANVPAGAVPLAAYQRRLIRNLLAPDSAGELVRQIVGAGLPVPLRECAFHPTRKWRFDLAWPDYLWALEIDGGLWVGGRHVQGAGFEQDLEKLNEAAILGWLVLRVTPRMVECGHALRLLERAFKA